MSELTYEARELIKARIEDLDAEERRLKTALAHMDAQPSRKPRRRGGRGRGRSKRSRRGQHQQQLLAALKAKPGSTAAEVARLVGVKPGKVYDLLRKARADKLIVKKGKGYALKT